MEERSSRLEERVATVEANGHSQRAGLESLTTRVRGNEFNIFLATRRQRRAIKRVRAAIAHASAQQGLSQLCFAFMKRVDVRFTNANMCFSDLDNFVRLGFAGVNRRMDNLDNFMRLGFADVNKRFAVVNQRIDKLQAGLAVLCKRVDGLRTALIVGYILAGVGGLLGGIGWLKIMQELRKLQRQLGPR